MSEYFFFEENELQIKYFTPSVLKGPIPCPYESVTDPNIFLTFAQEDVKQADLRGLVNAFSNLKKSIHIRIDLLLHQYGLYFFYHKNGFPTKLDLLDKIGVLPTTILRNLNSERNSLEHEYITPSKKRVDEALDIAELLYMATEPIITHTIIEAVGGFEISPYHQVIRLEPLLGELHLYDLDVGDNFQTETNGIKVIKGTLRDIFTGDVLPSFSLSDQPYRVIKLNKNSEKDWIPYIKLFTTIAKKKMFKGNSYSDGGSVTTTITLPISDLLSGKLTKIMTQMMKSNLEIEEE